MKHYIKYIAFTLLVLIGASSCKTKQVYRALGDSKQISKSDWKVKLNWKEESLSSKMRIEAAQGEGLYASLRPFPFVELARIWFKPTQIVVVDLMNQRYAKVRYKDLSKELGRRLNYKKLETLFFEELNRQTKEIALGRSPEQAFQIGQGNDKKIRLILLRNRQLDSSEDLHLEPKIKDDYQEISLKELKFLFKYLLGKVK